MKITPAVRHFWRLVPREERRNVLMLLKVTGKPLVPLLMQLDAGRAMVYGRVILR